MCSSHDEVRTTVWPEHNAFAAMRVGRAEIAYLATRGLALQEAACVVDPADTTGSEVAKRQHQAADVLLREVFGMEKLNHGEVVVDCNELALLIDTLLGVQTYDGEHEWEAMDAAFIARLQGLLPRVEDALNAVAS